MVLHPQAAAAVAQWADDESVTADGFGPDGVERKRAQARAAAALESREPVALARDLDADGVPCRLLVSSATRDRQPGVLLFLHGGGFVFGDLDTHDPQARRLANRTGLAVLAVGYRRPPEHPFPAAPDDVDTVLGWLAGRGDELGVDTDVLVTLGDSAGGNLALVAALRHPGRLRATVLVYPFLDPEQGFTSYAQTGVGMTAGECTWFWEQYAASPADLRDPGLAPLRSAGLGTLPPTLVQVADHDVLVGEDHELARRLAEADVAVELTTYDGMVHGFWRHPEIFDAAEVALAEIADFLARTV